MADTKISALPSDSSVTGAEELLVNDGGTSKKVSVNQLIAAARIPFMHVQDRKASGTDGGTNLVGDNTRALNAVLTNEISGASLSGDKITLPAGTYYVEGSAPALNVNAHGTHLYNFTDSGVIAYGTNERCISSDNVHNRSFIYGRFSLAGTKQIELRHYTQSVYASQGLGTALGIGFPEVYSDVRIWKVS